MVFKNPNPFLGVPWVLGKQTAWLTYQCLSSNIWNDTNKELKKHLQWSEDHQQIVDAYYIYIYSYIYIYTHIQLYIHVYIHIFIYIHIYIYRYTYIYTYIYRHKKQTSSVGIPGATWGSFPLHLRRSFGPGGRVVLSLEVWMVKDPLGSTGIHWDPLGDGQNMSKPSHTIGKPMESRGKPRKMMVKWWFNGD